MRGITRALCALLAAILALGCGAACARAEADPSDALLVPVTPKPWQQAAPETAPADVGAAEAYAAPAPTAEPPLTLPAVLNAADPDRLRVLLIGTDAYEADENGRSDTMVLVQVDVRTMEIRMVSFLRDLYVKIPGHGKTRLNAAYVYGRDALLLQTLQQNFGVTADFCIAVNFSRMVELIDRVGGVTVDVSEKERRQLNSILKFYNTQSGYPQKDQLLAEAGLVTLSGRQALCYSRIRKIDSDFQRTGRQRKVLMALFERLRGMDALSLMGALTDTFSLVRTDMTIADFAALIPVLLRFDQATFDSLTVPVSGGYHSETIKESSVLVPDLDANRDAIAAFLQ